MWTWRNIFWSPEAKISDPPNDGTSEAKRKMVDKNLKLVSDPSTSVQVLVNSDNLQDSIVHYYPGNWNKWIMIPVTYEIFDFYQ